MAQHLWTKSRITTEIRNWLIACYESAYAKGYSRVEAKRVATQATEHRLQKGTWGANYDPDSILPKTARNKITWMGLSPHADEGLYNSLIIHGRACKPEQLMKRVLRRIEKYDYRIAADILKVQSSFKSIFPSKHLATIMAMYGVRPENRRVRDSWRPIFRGRDMFISGAGSFNITEVTDKFDIATRKGVPLYVHEIQHIAYIRFGWSQGYFKTVVTDSQRYDYFKRHIEYYNQHPGALDDLAHKPSEPANGHGNNIDIMSELPNLTPEQLTARVAEIEEAQRLAWEQYNLQRLRNTQNFDRLDPIHRGFIDAGTDLMSHELPPWPTYLKDLPPIYVPANETHGCPEVKITAIATPQQLKHESDRFHNCAENYATQIRRNGSRIYVAYTTGSKPKPYAMLMFDVHEHMSIISGLVQCYGPCNRLVNMVHQSVMSNGIQHTHNDWVDTVIRKIPDEELQAVS